MTIYSLSILVIMTAILVVAIRNCTIITEILALKLLQLGPDHCSDKFLKNTYAGDRQLLVQPFLQVM